MLSSTNWFCGVFDQLRSIGLDSSAGRAYHVCQQNKCNKCTFHFLLCAQNSRRDCTSGQWSHRKFHGQLNGGTLRDQKVGNGNTASSLQHGRVREQARDPYTLLPAKGQKGQGGRLTMVLYHQPGWRSCHPGISLAPSL